MKIKKLVAMILIMLISFSMVLSVSASGAPTNTYTRRWHADETNTLQLSREMYEMETVLNASSLKVSEPLEEITSETRRIA